MSCKFNCYSNFLSNNSWWLVELVMHQVHHLLLVQQAKGSNSIFQLSTHQQAVVVVEVTNLLQVLNEWWTQVDLVVELVVKLLSYPANGTGNTPPVSPAQGNNGGDGGSATQWIAGGGGGGAGATGGGTSSRKMQGSGGVGGIIGPKSIYWTYSSKLWNTRTSSNSCKIFCWRWWWFNNKHSWNKRWKLVVLVVEAGAGYCGSSSGANGATNTGGGGGGGGPEVTGGGGASGIVMIRYKFQ